MGVLVDDETQMSFARDQDAVGGLASACSHPALGDRVHPGHARQDGHHSGANGGEDRVEPLGEVARVAPDQDLDILRCGRAGQQPKPVQEQAAKPVDQTYRHENRARTEAAGETVDVITS
ncbi:hypothetical protein ACFRAO_00175 [Streptomyces sp. NPDC056656]|uniref:hypothetical protein n=1 Tax=Streptomyces sp. NPDC056656 TaxID=3345895 RepID=UPI003689CBA4